jgi:hypothetical protein
LFVVGVEVAAAALVAELQESVGATVLAADTGCEPAAPRRVLVVEVAEALVERMALDLLLGESDDLFGRDRHPVEPEAARVDAEVAVAPVALAEAEVLARLAPVAVGPQLERGLFGAGERACERACPAEDGVDALRQLPVIAIGVDTDAISIPTSPCCTPSSLAVPDPAARLRVVPCLERDQTTRRRRGERERDQRGQVHGEQGERK